MESSSPESPIGSQATTIVSPSDDENSSIVTVRDNGEQLQLVVDTDAAFDSFDEHISNALGVQYPDKSPVVQTVVEVISPLISGEGHANQISIAATGDSHVENADKDTEAYDEKDGQISSIINLHDEQQHDDDSDEFELSLSDKMKNVLQELVENERVKLSFSKSITEDDDEPDSVSECDEVFNNNEAVLSASLTETNGNVVDSSIVSTKTSSSSDDKDSLNANINEANTLSNEDDQLVADVIADVDTPLTDEQTDKSAAAKATAATATTETEIDAEQDDDDDNSQEKTVSTSSATDSSNKSINNNKKKKKKGKGKKK